MKTICITLLSLLTSTSFAKCLDYNQADVMVSWEAFKTPAKVGVKGEFKKFKIIPAKQKGNISEVLNGATFEVDSTSVHTKNKARDNKIVKNFFKDVDIKGKVTSVKAKKFVIDMVIKGKKLKVPMTYVIQGNTLSANGTIDVFDFLLHDNLKAINKACYALHEGKTWNDVNIYLKSTFRPCQ